MLLPTISCASVWRPSHRSAAATHSTPGSWMAFVSSPDPCMPMPMMPKRTRSLGGVDCKGRGMCSGSRKIRGEAASAPVAPALRWRNSRRDRLFFMVRSSKKLTVDSLQFKPEPKNQIPRSAKTCAALKSELRLRSEEHTSELQSRVDLVCRLLLEKKKEE